MEGMKISHILFLVFVGVVYVVTQVIQDEQDAQGCLQVGDLNACEGRSGDYNACKPDCANGTFISCSNEAPVVMTCADGWYKRQLDPPTGMRLAKTVFDPPSRSCQYTSSSCPRDLDNYVLTDK
ncbi:hypothetical protein BsWGS_25297 [Bradybaena similaris]